MAKGGAVTPASHGPGDSTLHRLVLGICTVPGGQVTVLAGWLAPDWVCIP